MRNQFGDACTFNGRKVELHMRCILLELLEEGLLWSAQNIMDFMNLIEFIVTWEKGEE